MKRRVLNIIDWVAALLIIGTCAGLIALMVASWPGCAVRRWENRIQRVEDAVDTVDYVADKSEKIIDKTKSLSPPVAR